MNDQSGPVNPVLAMNKNGLRGRIAHDGEDFVDTRVILVAHWIDRIERF